MVNMASLCHMNHDGAHDGQQRSLEDFQFDLENVLTHVTAGWEVSRRAQRGLSDAGNLCRYQEQDCSRGCGRDRHRRAKTQWTKKCCTRCLRQTLPEWSMCLVRGCAKSLVETRVRRVSQKCFDTVGRTTSRSKTCGVKWAKRVSKLPHESLSSQAIEQLTISGLSRHGQPEP